VLLTPLTLLEAVNRLLEAIAETPVSSLESSSGDADVAAALRLLRWYSVALQSRGWHFNTEENVPLIRNMAGEIPLPTNCHKVDTMGVDQLVNVTQRGLRLYNLGTRSFVFDKDLVGRMVVMLDWDELPPHAREMITANAARKFQMDRLGDATRDERLANDVFMAQVQFNQAEADVGDHNIFTGSQDVLSIWAAGRDHSPLWIA
jgi:hypothetical protein